MWTAIGHVFIAIFALSVAWLCVSQVVSERCARKAHRSLYTVRGQWTRTQEVLQSYPPQAEEEKGK